MTTPKVSVIVTCYNRQETIEEAIISVVDQKTTFNYEVIVVDDGSTDNSRVLIERLIIRGIIKGDDVHLLSHRGLMLTFKYALEQCKGEYLAFCDGDDYWCNEDKLQKQVEFMDNNPHFGLCSTNTYLSINGVIKPTNETSATKSITFDNLLTGNRYLYWQSFMIRKSDFDKYCDFNKYIRLGFYTQDYPMILDLRLKTGFAHLNFYSAVYVVYTNSHTHTHSRWKRLKLIFNQAWVKAYFVGKYGCKLSTFLFITYKFIRDMYSIVFKRWYK